MTEANHTFMHELNAGRGATVDSPMVPIVKFLNRLNVTTVNSHMDGEFASVTFTGKDPLQMADLIFNHLKAMTETFPWVHLELFFEGGNTMGYTGVIEVRAEDLSEFSTRVGCWVDLRGK
jgi:hypothetical protein